MKEPPTVSVQNQTWFKISKKKSKPSLKKKTNPEKNLVKLIITHRPHKTMFRLEKIGRTSEIYLASLKTRAKLEEADRNLAVLSLHHSSNMNAIKVLPEDTPVFRKDDVCLPDVGVIQHGKLHLLGESIREMVARLMAALIELEYFYDVDRFVLRATSLVDTLRENTLAVVMEGLVTHPYARADFTSYFDVVQLLYARTTELSKKLREVETAYAEGNALYTKRSDAEEDEGGDTESRRDPDQGWQPINLSEERLPQVTE